jgi:hypothetical protein
VRQETVLRESQTTVHLHDFVNDSSRHVGDSDLRMSYGTTASSIPHNVHCFGRVKHNETHGVYVEPHLCQAFDVAVELANQFAARFLSWVNRSDESHLVGALRLSYEAHTINRIMISLTDH